MKEPIWYGTWREENIRYEIRDRATGKIQAIWYGCGAVWALDWFMKAGHRRHGEEHDEALYIVVRAPVQIRHGE